MGCYTGEGMKENDHIDYELISKVLSGNALPDEISIVDSWRKANELNEVQYKHLERTWRLSEPVSFDPTSAWQHIEPQLQKRSVPSKSHRWLQVAAAITIIAVVGWFLWQPSPVTQQFVAAEVSTHTLHDASIVTMNKGSEVNFEESEQERVVEMKGEVFFEVTRAPSKVFKVQTKFGLVEVLGTKFNVKEDLENESTTVIVEEGRVRLSDFHGNDIELTAGMSATTNNKSREIIENDPESESLFWKNRSLVFRNQTLEEVCRILSNQYNTTIEVEDAGNCLFSSTFENEEIGTIITIIAATLNLEVETNNGITILKGQACP